MDASHSPDRASPGAVAALDELFGPRPARNDRVSARMRGERHHLLAALHAVHDREGWLSLGSINEIGFRTGVAAAEVFGVASFYAQFALAERPSTTVTHVCVDAACRLVGSTTLADQPGSLPSPCLGLCERAPAALTVSYGNPRVDRVGNGDEPPPVAAVRLSGPLLARVGVVDPSSLDDYRAHGGYEALRRAMALGPRETVREISDAGLVGRGGAAFPTGRKWEAVAAEPAHTKELVANADESEPGTFKDRVLLEGDPFALIEAMTIAGFAVGAKRGHIYLRGEYPRAWQTLEGAIHTARARGLLGNDVMGHGFAFDIVLHRGAGAYICGEETAIFNSIEGFRGEPRSKPPFPFQVGLFGRPTLVNNVETLMCVPNILRQGAARWRAGETKLFAVSGSVVNPGVVEVPMGTPLQDVIDACGGVLAGRTLRAVLLGGVAGSFVGADQLALPLSFDGARAAGSTLGSGVVLVVDDRADTADLVQRIAAFFRDESCGQCVPCRVGTVRQEEAVVRLRRGLASPAPEGDRALLADLGSVLRDASICGLGQTAHSAVESALRLGLLP